ncbi:hypothetical protein ACFFMR_31430 [Micromonospora andamanensis]|nr:hypothetical protein [Micromonospora andamanensis]
MARRHLGQIDAVPGPPYECVVVEVAEPHRDAHRITAHYRPMPVCAEQGYPFVPLTAD